jgi:hypothetical protein
MTSPSQESPREHKRHSYHVGNSKGSKSSVSGTEGRDHIQISYDTFPHFLSGPRPSLVFQFTFPSSCFQQSSAQERR